MAFVMAYKVSLSLLSLINISSAHVLSDKANFLL